MEQDRSQTERERRRLAVTAIAITTGAALLLVANATLARSIGLSEAAGGVLGASTLIALAIAGGVVLGRARSLPRVARGVAETAALAHDLRAPLATAQSLLEVLRSGELGTLTAEATDAATRAASALARAQAVLEGALRAVSPAAEAPATDLDGVLDRTLVALAGGIAQSGAIVERGALPTVRGDAIALERVLANLVVNAIVHARPGQPPRIEVDARRQGSGWLISVSDDGPGVPEQIRDSAFEPGVRGFAPDGPTGFGLGLATVRRLVEQQGGRAWIDPDTSDGTRVQLLLPAA